MKHEPTENAMAKEHDRQERIIADSFDRHKALTSSRNPQNLHGCPNPDCVNGWHGKEVMGPHGHCVGSWAWNDDGTPREGMEGGRFTESFNAPDRPPTTDRLSRVFGPLPQDREVR